MDFEVDVFKNDLLDGIENEMAQPPLPVLDPLCPEGQGQFSFFVVGGEGDVLKAEPVHPFGSLGSRQIGFFTVRRRPEEEQGEKQQNDKEKETQQGGRYGEAKELAFCSHNFFGKVSQTGPEINGRRIIGRRIIE